MLSLVDSYVSSAHSDVRELGSDPTSGVNAEDYLNIYARVNEALERAKWRAEANMDAETKAEITRARYPTIHQ